MDDNLVWFTVSGNGEFLLSDKPPLDRTKVENYFLQSTNVIKVNEIFVLNLLGYIPTYDETPFRINTYLENINRGKTK